MTPTLTTHVHTGDAARAAIHAEAGFIDRHSTAFSTTAAWLAAAAEHLPGEPVLLTVRRDGATVALAPLSVLQRRGARRIELLGGELNDYGQLFAEDEQAAAALADSLAGWVVAQRRWTLTLSQLPAGDPVAAALAARLGGVVVEGPAMPLIAGVGTDYRVSRNRIRKNTKMLNRLEVDGVAWEQLVIDDPTGLEQWLHPIIEVRRARDHGHGRRSHLDDPAARAFYEAVVRSAFARDRAVLHLVVVDRAVAGFGLVMRDGGAHRLFDGRVAEELQRYSGGSICDLAAVRAAEQDPEVATFDWLRGTTDGKYGNDEVHRYELRAHSHRWITAVDEGERVARQRIKATLPDAAVRRLVSR